MRAKKFGAPLSLEARKMVRAERFSQNAAPSTGGDTTKNKITLSNSVSRYTDIYLFICTRRF